MSKSLSLRDSIVAMARQKHAAARARSSTSDAEKPRDVILRACQAIAEELRADGFRFLKSGPMLKRVKDGRDFKIVFQSDRNNIAGMRAAVWIHAIVDEAGSYKRIAGGQIGNLLPDRSWMEWDFADESSREAEIADAVAAIRRIILPFFAVIERQTT